MASMTRRQVMGAGAVLGATVALGAAAPAQASAAASGTAKTAVRPRRRVREETRALDELYSAALNEGGKLVIYAGGDTADQQDATKQAFLSQFADIDLTLVVDYSKYHDVRIDNQLATHTLVPDVVQLQTLQDFERWKDLGVLRAYKPAGFSSLYPHFRDADGAWVALAVYAFSYMYDADLGASGPATPEDLVDPQWKGAISSSYPNDDDAVLYLYKLWVDAYGWEWVARLAEQEIVFGRGTPTPIVAVASKQKKVGIGGAGSLLAPLAPGVQWVVPQRHPFMAWAQRAGVLAQAPHPAAAELYLNCAISQPVQQASFDGWSVRTDVVPPNGLKQIWEYPNAHVDGFARFMSDRGKVERWRQIFTIYFGEVQGPPTPGGLGLHPGQS